MCGNMYCGNTVIQNNGIPVYSPGCDCDSFFSQRFPAVCVMGRQKTNDAPAPEKEQRKVFAGIV